jgi:hypothetical protein
LASSIDWVLGAGFAFVQIQPPAFDVSAHYVNPAILWIAVPRAKLIERANILVTLLISPLVLGFLVAEQDPEHGGVFMTLGDGFHTLDITQHPAPADAARPERGQLGLIHIAFKVDSYAALRDAYAHLLAKGARSSALSIMSASAAFISPIRTATASKSISKCRTR